MSEILFCDPGNHQFSANDPDRKTWTEKQSYADANAGKTPLRFDACSEHKGYDGMGTDKVKAQAEALQRMLDTPKAVAGAVRKDNKRLVDADEYARYIEFLERGEE